MVVSGAPGDVGVRARHEGGLRPGAAVTARYVFTFRPSVKLMCTVGTQKLSVKRLSLVLLL